MKCIIITQIVDVKNDLLGFFVSWIEELSKYFEKISVISFKESNYTMNDKVNLYKIKNRKFKILKIMDFYKIFLKLLISNNYDFVFIHMIPEYVILSYIPSIFKKIPLFLWYSHKSLSFRLKLAHKMVKIIFTSNKKGCRLKSLKVNIINHGINTEKFSPKLTKKKSNTFNILSVGRISKIKNYETIINAIDILINSKNLTDIRLKIIGRPISSMDLKYYEFLISLIKEKELTKYVRFIGEVPYSRIETYFQNSDLFISTSLNESFDKVVLEALSCQIPTLTSIYSFKNIIGENLIFKKKNYQKLAQKIEDWYYFKKFNKIQSLNYREFIEKEFSVHSTMKKMAKIFRNYIGSR
ncbi:MAG: glycosyltransferase family 4 protein [Candidatus Helarchaeota archaeon]